MHKQMVDMIKKEIADCGEAIVPFSTMSHIIESFMNSKPAPQGVLSPWSLVIAKFEGHDPALDILRDLFKSDGNTYYSIEEQITHDNMPSYRIRGVSQEIKQTMDKVRNALQERIQNANNPLGFSYSSDGQFITPDFKPAHAESLTIDLNLVASDSTDENNK